MTTAQPTVEVLRPRRVGEERWMTLQGIVRLALGDVLQGRCPESDVDALVHWGDPDSFMRIYTHPNSTVGGRRNPNQSYSNPYVAIAKFGDEIVGWGHSATNVSGPPLRRAYKQLLVPGKRYYWLGGVYVVPDRQNRGVGTAVLRALLGAAQPNQPVTAYVWPEIPPSGGAFSLQQKLEAIGFEATGSQQVHPFQHAPGVEEVRLQADSAAAVLAALDTRVR